MTEHVASWNDVQARHVELGPMSAEWQNIGDAVGSVNVGLRRLRIHPGRRSTPVHVHDAEEEIFFLLSGDGLSWQDDAAVPVRAGDCLVHRAGAEAHSLIAGEQGLEVLVFGTRVPVETCRLPRAGVAWLTPTWIDLDPGDSPWRREAGAGELDMSKRKGRDGRVLNVDEAEPEPGEHGDIVGVIRDLAGQRSRVSGLQHAAAEPGKLVFPPHVHTAEEELFVVLAGEGELELWNCRRPGSEPARTPISAGSVVCRPAGTGVAHSLRAGEQGLTFLAYGQRDPRDIAFYPRSRKLNVSGAGVIVRVEQLSYWDGEE